MKATLNSTVGHRTPLAALQYADSLQLLEAGEIGWGMIIAWPGGGQASKQANGTSYFGHHVLNYVSSNLQHIRLGYVCLI
jgi:hypothetical protein